MKQWIPDETPGLHHWGEVIDNRMQFDICGAVMTLDPDDGGDEGGVWTYEA